MIAKRTSIETFNLISVKVCFTLFIFFFTWMSNLHSFEVDPEFLFIEDVIAEEANQKPSDQVIVFTLETAVARALKYNRNMLAQYDSLLKSKFGVDLAYTEFEINFTPNGQAGYTGGGRGGSGGTFGAGFDISKKFDFGTRFSLSPSIFKSNDYYHTNLKTTITQPLLKGFGREYTLSSLKASQFNLRSSLRQLYVTQASLVIKTLTSCYEIIRQEESLKLTKESHDRLVQFRNAAVLKEKIGLADGLDVLRAEIELKQAEENLLNGVERLQEAYDILKDTLAFPLESEIKIEAPLEFQKKEINMEESIQTALGTRIEIDQAHDQYNEMLRLAKISKMNLLPDLNVVLTYNNLGQHHDLFNEALKEREHGWGIGFTSSNDFNKDAQKLAFEHSLLNIANAERNLLQVQDNVVLEVKRAIRTLNRASTKIQTQSQQIKNAEGELYLARIKFDHGQANNFDVIQAEKNFRNAQANYINAIIEYILGEYQLWSSLGIMLTKPIIN